MTILVTGSAGFIGFHLSWRLLECGDQVIGVAALNAYYDPALEGHAGYRNARPSTIRPRPQSRLVSAASSTGISTTMASAERDMRPQGGAWRPAEPGDDRLARI